MDVFISWAKQTSRAVADALRDWLPDILQTVRPWMSSADIGAGERWSLKIAEALATSKVGIICVTPENQREPWLLFEAGALAKTLENTRVCPYLVNLQPQELLAGPLTQFQAKEASEVGTFELVATINQALGSSALAEDRLRRLFDRGWPDLKKRLECLPPSPKVAARQPEEMLAEVLETVRSISRRIPAARPEVSPEQLARRQRMLKISVIRHQLVRALPDLPAGPRGRFLRTLQSMSDDELDILKSELRGQDAKANAGLILARLGESDPDVDDHPSGSDDSGAPEP